MRRSRIRHFAELFCSWYPYAIALVFLATACAEQARDKWAFLGRAMLALVVATFLAHVNRIFHLWPAHLLFPSGHTTFCLGLSLSLAMLRPWTLYATMPLLLVLVVSLVALRYHTVMDIVGAFPLVLVIYGVIHWAWRLPLDSGRIPHFNFAI